MRDFNSLIKSYISRPIELSRLFSLRYKVTSQTALLNFPIILVGLKLQIKATLQLLIVKEIGYFKLPSSAQEYFNLLVLGSVALLRLMVLILSQGIE